MRQTMYHLHRHKSQRHSYFHARVCFRDLMCSCSMNAPPLVEVRGETDPLKIAMMELNANVIPIIIRRHLPGGAYEDWPVSELIQ